MPPQKRYAPVRRWHREDREVHDAAEKDNEWAEHPAEQIDRAWRAGRPSMSGRRLTSRAWRGGDALHPGPESVEMYTTLLYHYREARIDKR